MPIRRERDENGTFWGEVMGRRRGIPVAEGSLGEEVPPRYSFEGMGRGTVSLGSLGQRPTFTPRPTLSEPIVTPPEPMSPEPVAPLSAEQRANRAFFAKMSPAQEQQVRRTMFSPTENTAARKAYRDEFNTLLATEQERDRETLRQRRIDAELKNRVDVAEGRGIDVARTKTEAEAKRQLADQAWRTAENMAALQGKKDLLTQEQSGKLSEIEKTYGAKTTYMIAEMAAEAKNDTAHLNQLAMNKVAELTQTGQNEQAIAVINGVSQFMKANAPVMKTEVSPEAAAAAIAGASGLMPKPSAKSTDVFNDATGRWEAAGDTGGVRGIPDKEETAHNSHLGFLSRYDALPENDPRRDALRAKYDEATMEVGAFRTKYKALLNKEQ